jgi:NAD(P)-dependent dehydrogenase (short-subunit alcohol dehydrogenase family)
MTSFMNKVVVIVGGSRGIGLATARAIAKEQGRLVLFARDRARLETAADQARSAGAAEVAWVAGDLAQAADLERLAAEAERRGGVDALFCSAGFAPFAPIAESEPAFVSRALAVNVAGPIHLARVMEPHLRPGAAVLWTASGMHARPLAQASVWATTTSAVVGLSRALAVEWAPRRIRVNAISHGPVDTPIYEDYGMPPEAVVAMKTKLAAQTLVGRLGHVDEIARLAKELLLPEGFITGTEVVADGGWALGAG